MPDPTTAEITAFISRWETSGAAERANYQMFLAELCDIIDVPRPDPTSHDSSKNRSIFDRSITRIHPDGATSTVYIDLSKAGCFGMVGRIWNVTDGHRHAATMLEHRLRR